jgi:hypothetical protein
VTGNKWADLDWSDGWWLRKHHGPLDAALADDAFYGVQSWVDGWRQTHGSGGPLPPDYRLMERVGRDAVLLMREGVPRVQLSKLMWAAGRDGVPLNVPAVPS